MLPPTLSVNKNNMAGTEGAMEQRRELWNVEIF